MPMPMDGVAKFTGTLATRDVEDTMAERLADGAIHVAGLMFAATAVIWLSYRVFSQSDITLISTVMIYAVALVAMLSMSAIYNVFHRPDAYGIWRRLDHAAIFLMIAGTYTPFAAMVLGGWVGASILAIVWTGAVLGILIKLCFREGFGRYTLPLYLALGWVVVIALPPLIERMSTPGLWLLLGGGLIYSAGTLFYAWRSLPFQNAIWHAFVLAAAMCQFGAVLTDVAKLPGV